jgi:DNA gyrase/topoisomerase IV subunit A
LQVAIHAFTNDKIVFAMSNGQFFTLDANKIPSGRGYGEPVRLMIDLPVDADLVKMFVADVNARLIENIFFKNSPLHDGAMIIADNRIKAAACILPVAQTTNLPKEMGLRHRSGLGMSIETDALIIIVSEERGKISVAQNGKIEANVTAEELQQILSKEREVKNYC